MPNWLIIILTGFVQLLLKNASPILREKLEEFLLELEKRAHETPNPVDDMLVDFLKRIFKVE